MRYRLAFLQGDGDAMKEQARWVTGKPREDWILSEQASTAAYYGRVRSAYEFSGRAVQLARKLKTEETAAQWKTRQAMVEAEVGNAVTAHQMSAEALNISQGKVIESTAAVALARVGDTRTGANIG